MRDQPGAAELPEIAGSIKFEHVSFRYRPELPRVLHDICLEIHPGQTVALVGPTGSGKDIHLGTLSPVFTMLQRVQC